MLGREPSLLTYFFMAPTLRLAAMLFYTGHFYSQISEALIVLRQTVKLV